MPAVIVYSPNSSIWLLARANPKVIGSPFAEKSGWEPETTSVPHSPPPTISTNCDACRFSRTRGN
jgi:hypothetical protein